MWGLTSAIVFVLCISVNSQGPAIAPNARPSGPPSAAPTSSLISGKCAFGKGVQKLIFGKKWDSIKR